MTTAAKAFGPFDFRSFDQLSGRFSYRESHGSLIAFAEAKACTDGVSIYAVWGKVIGRVLCFNCVLALMGCVFVLSSGTPVPAFGNPRHELNYLCLSTQMVKLGPASGWEHAASSTSRLAWTTAGKRIGRVCWLHV